MNRYLALLRGINVGGNNIIKMSELKAAFERFGFRDVATYINSGNVLFSSESNETATKDACERLIAEAFGLAIPVCVISDRELTEALAHAPEWWNQDSESKHNAIFVIPPATAAELCSTVGAVSEEYERVAHHGRVIFWSAPLATFSRTRWSKISQDKAMYRAITIRNANTASKLAELMR